VAIKRYAVVLSDVHIGSGTPTCWYQPAVHDRPLSEALAWILARRDTIREVVLLGDMFDVWTYPPTLRPPGMREIIAANPRMLGPSGPLAALARALPGEVRLLLGNHDGSLTRADIAALGASLGAPIELVTAPWRVVAGASGVRTVFAHGHHSCMFNAPDARSRWGTIPIGHFVSRAIGYQLARTLRPGQTSADRGNSGNPTGIDLGAIVRHWNRRDDLAEFLIAYICDATGMPRTQPIVMPDGSTATPQDAGRVFAGLFTLWLRREGRLVDAMRAANADRGGGEDLAFFAQRLAMQTGSDLAVMGHTHSAVTGLTVSPVDYVNNGYMCVSRPDLASGTQITFTQVDLERATAQVLAVVPAGGGRFSVVPARARRLPSAIVHGRDYSCYARVENRTSRPLQLVRSAQDSASYWVVRPPALIPAHGRLDMWLQDSAFDPRGSTGSFSYSDGTRTYAFSMTCPTVLDNAVSSAVPYQTKVGSNPWRTGTVDPSGYPVQARFFVGAARPARIGPASSGPGAPGAVALPPRRRRRPCPVDIPRGRPVAESPFVLASRAILDGAGVDCARGVVLTVTHLTSNTGRPLLDPATDPSGARLRYPPAHLTSPEVHSVIVAGKAFRYVFIHPNVSNVAPPVIGGMAFLPAVGTSTFTLATINVAGLDPDICSNGHHAELQLVGFVRAQGARWQTQLARIEMHNYSRKGPTWGLSACNACLSDLAAFLRALNALPRSDRARASISWERLYTKNVACGYPTDAANIRALVRAGWDEPQGKRPAGTQWPVAPTPALTR
jgi:hypothetical protein